MCRIFNESYVPHGLKVVQAYAESGLPGLIELERRWRQHFLSSMQPKFLPPLWSVDHNHEKYLRKYGENLLITLTWAHTLSLHRGRQRWFGPRTGRSRPKPVMCFSVFLRDGLDLILTPTWCEFWDCQWTGRAQPQALDCGLTVITKGMMGRVKKLKRWNALYVRHELGEQFSTFHEMKLVYFY